MIVMYLLMAMVGALMGSLLNAYIHRECLNEKTGSKESLLWPRRSYCPRCRATIAWYDNIPLLSYLLLKGRCRSCEKPVAFRYVLVEALTSLFSVFMYDLFYVQRHDVVGLGVALFLTCLLVAIVFIDLEVMIIPDLVSLGGLGVALAVGFLCPEWHDVDLNATFWIKHLNGLREALYGMVMGGGLIYAIGLMGSWVLKKEAMGGGDVKMMAMVGAFLGWTSAWLILFLASFVGTVVSMFMLVHKSKQMSEEIPFGPYLAAGSLIALCWQDAIYQWLFYRG